MPRQHEVTRLEGFSDAVFAVALALLVVSLGIPSWNGFRLGAALRALDRSERVATSEPRERRGDHGAPASERVGGSAGAKPPGSGEVA